MFDNVLTKLLKPYINENPFIYEIKDNKLINFVRFLRGNTSVAKLYCNERIVEYPFVLRNLDLPVGSKVLEIGATMSALSFMLACLGHKVVALDVRDYEFKHPNLTFIKADFFDFKTNEVFDCIICVSVLEHMGLGFYGDKKVGTDIDAVNKMRQLLRDDGILLLTVPFGRYYECHWFRVYDSSRLRSLLDGFEIEVLEFYKRINEYVWLPTTSDELENIDSSEFKPRCEGVVCVKARRA